ncbi:MAG TPA: MotA/TolQ/ExbB proton channel family protein [Tepidisphaeraceae bacterium]|jgi:biopolymer transport protein ExbB|nr:MotA/TolQ/ExbB proton channel family protein [Tepidisphaeraceae bacterium]
MNALKRLPLQPLLRIFSCAAVAAFLLYIAAIAQAQTRPAAPSTQVTEVRTHPPDISFLQLLLRGGWFMVPIGVASMIGLALVLERWVALRRGKIIPRRFMRDLKRITPEGGENREAALRYCREHPSPISRITAAGLRKLPQGHAAVERAVEDTGGNEVQKLRRNMRMMYGLTVITPMLGLLGTVWGMIDAFRITSSAQGLGKPELLAKGIYEALVCTLAALMVAIPILMIYYYFIAKIERYVAEMNELSIDFADHFLEHPTRKSQPASLETVLKSEI